MKNKIVVIGNELGWSFALGGVTSIYYWPEIIARFSSAPVFFAGLSIQMIHDGVCFLFVALVMTSIWERSIPKLLILNMIHCGAMGFFAYYKRCILTLVYNNLMGLPSCTRYIPIWQRCIHGFVQTQCHDANNINNTYLWLNDHIIKSVIVCLANLLCFCSSEFI